MRCNWKPKTRDPLVQRGAHHDDHGDDDHDQNENIPIVQCDQKTCHMVFIIIPSVSILPGLDKGEINYQHDH